MTGHSTIFVLAATVAGDLRAVRDTAKQIALGAKNAKALAVRAGDKARGFQPITNFIDEMASDTIQLSGEIDRQALHLSRVAVAEARMVDAMERFQRARSRAANAPHVDSVGTPIARVQRRWRGFDSELQGYVGHLCELLDQIGKSARGAKVIATNSRVEAACADEFRPNLEKVATGLEQAAGTIQDRVTDCRDRLLAGVQSRGNLTREEET